VLAEKLIADQEVPTRLRNSNFHNGVPDEVPCGPILSFVNPAYICTLCDSF